MAFKILFSNMGYARGIDGSFSQHIRHAYRHVYLDIAQQEKVLAQFKCIIAEEKPDICCLVEIDSGAWNNGYFNQITHLLDDEYKVHSIAGKYGEDSVLSQMPFFAGKCNAFLARRETPFEKLYFKHGSKRLIYVLRLPGNIQLYFAHFSLQAKVRARQFDEVRNLIKDNDGEVIILADFNIMQGFRELAPLLDGMRLHVMNAETDHTFIIGNNRWTLDLCICSESLASRLELKIIPQPYSDHAALLVQGDLV